MIIILGFDALEKSLVEKYKCVELMQESYGNTDITDFNAERTVVLWASFLTGKNMEDKIPLKGQWQFTLPMKDTLFSGFKTPFAIDVPAFTLRQDDHEKERRYLAGYFKDENTVEEFDEVVWSIHEETKREFLSRLEENYDILMAYFNLADTVGHLSFGIDEKMRKVYEELNSIARTARKKGATIFIVSDHGMKQVGRFGDHTSHGFWSFNRDMKLDKPKITDFRKTIEQLRQ